MKIHKLVNIYLLITTLKNNIIIICIKINSSILTFTFKQIIKIKYFSSYFTSLCFLPHKFSKPKHIYYKSL